VLAIALLGVPCAAPAAPPSAAADIEPVAILARYEATLATLKRPKAMTFDYSVEQLGLRNMEQTHHVYRSGLAERDETLVVDGFTLPRPSVRIIANRSYRYEITAVAPRQTTYAFVYTGSKFGANGLSYVFHTEPRAPTSFAVSEIELDARGFLPTVVRFKIAGYGARGSGTLSYGPAEGYWVVHQAQVNAHLTSGALAHERIIWSNYQFPPSLPKSTFQPPRGVVPLDPEDLATPAPEADPNAP
jgi:hypothetical protein